MLQEIFAPKISREVQKLVDEDTVRNIKYISFAVVFFELITLLLYVLTRKSFGLGEWASIGSVAYCIVTCLLGFLFARQIIRDASYSQRYVMGFKAAYFLLMSVWAIWAAFREYSRGEQILTFYAVEVMLVCFITLRPWMSSLLTACVYGALFVVLSGVDGAAGIQILNYGVLAIVSVIGMIVRYRSSVRMAETTVQLQLSKDSEIRDQINILQSMADIYDNVNLIDFADNTEMSVRDKNQVRHTIDLGPQTHTRMSQRIRERVMPDQREAFISFTDITTVRARLVGRKLLSADFIDVVDGWFRAQYIPVGLDGTGLPLRVIFTTRNVDEEKKREEGLIRIAMTDELTRLYNRRSYEEDLAQYRSRPPEEDFVVLSADVNGLKKVNDTLGHAAGDELIKGAADCLVLGIGSAGKVYRTGGDEFMAILHTADPEAVCEGIKKQAAGWRGRFSGEMSVSLGYAAHSQFPTLDIDELEKKADEEMYQAKASHYREKGVDRRYP